MLNSDKIEVNVTLIEICCTYFGINVQIVDEVRNLGLIFANIFFSVVSSFPLFLCKLSSFCAV